MQKLFIFSLLFFCTTVSLKAAALSDQQPDFKVTENHLNLVAINRGLGAALVPPLAAELRSFKENVRHSVTRATTTLVKAIRSNDILNIRNALSLGADPEASVLVYDETTQTKVYKPLTATTDSIVILMLLSGAKIEIRIRATEALEFYTPTPDCCECKKKQQAEAMTTYLASIIAQS